jgi:hypothetical protein
MLSEKIEILMVKFGNILDLTVKPIIIFIENILLIIIENESKH